MTTVQYYFKFLCFEKSSISQEAQLSSGKEVKLHLGKEYDLLVSLQKCEGPLSRLGFVFGNMSAFTSFLMKYTCQLRCLLSKVHEQIWNTETINGLLHKMCSKSEIFFFKCHIKSHMACETFRCRKCQVVCYSFFFFLILKANLKLLKMFSMWHFFFPEYGIYSITV